MSLKTFIKVIQESLDYFFHSFFAPPYIKELGLLKELVAIKYRQKRMSSQWLEHQEKTKLEIIKATQTLKQKRKAIILGAGLLLDVPLEHLSKSFQEVILVDIFFLQETIEQINLYENCQFQELDITGILKESLSVLKSNQDFNIFFEKFLNKRPSHFLNDADIDFVVSCNMLSQLTLPIEKYLTKKKIPLDTLKEHFLELIKLKHLEYLKSFAKDSFKLLITDKEQNFIDKENQQIEKNIHLADELFNDFNKQNSWQWQLADYGEIDKDYQIKLLVEAYSYS